MINNELSNLWEQHLAEYATSGKSISSWCKEQPIRDNLSILKLKQAIFAN
jgi:hypothetical protein